MGREFEDDWGAHTDFVATAKRLQAQQRHEPNAQRDLALQPPALGKLLELPPRTPTGSLRLEQNLGCELPVCVANRTHVGRDTIAFANDAGVQWTLRRLAGRLLPAPEHYRPWLWFLDRCVEAADTELAVPRIRINPREILAMFPQQRPGGSQYRHLDEAFVRFASLHVEAHAAVHFRGEDWTGHGQLGALITYESWRRIGAEKGLAWAQPGRLLWQSIRAGYLKAVPLGPLQALDKFVAQRLYTYLEKHCAPGGTFEISAAKLLPKIPLECAAKNVRNVLAAHHAALVDIGFLARAPGFRGRGEDRIIGYKRR